jgi:hypothetical protein
MESFSSSKSKSKSKSKSTSGSQSLSQPLCWPENGAFLVVGPPGSPGISPALYAMLYPYMIGCTFPVTGDLELSKILCPGFQPSRTYRHILVRKFQKLGCRFLFLPKHLYLFFYYLFITKNIDHNTPMKLGALDSQDNAMCSEYKKNRSLTNYFTTVVAELVQDADHLGHFNAWAVAFLCHPDRHLLSLSALHEDTITELSPQGALTVLESLLEFALNTPDVGVKSVNARVSQRLPTLAPVLKEIVRLEVEMPHCTFLTRFGESTKGVYITQRNKTTGQLSPSSYSQSFGADIFAAAFGSDTHACTLYSMDDKHTIFLLPISIEDFKLRRQVAGCFWIPPYPPPCQFYAEMNELWHPRSRIFVRTAPKKLFRRDDVVLHGQTIEGISEYGILLFDRKWNREIEPLGFLYYHELLSDEKILEFCLFVEAYIAEKSFVLMKK